MQAAAFPAVETTPCEVCHLRNDHTKDVALPEKGLQGALLPTRNLIPSKRHHIRLVGKKISAFLVGLLSKEVHLQVCAQSTPATPAAALKLHRIFKTLAVSMAQSIVGSSATTITKA
jgi:hypothetical protein